MDSTHNSTTSTWGIKYWTRDGRAPTFSLLPHDYTKDSDPSETKFYPRWDLLTHVYKEEPPSRPEPKFHDWWIDQPKSLHERGFSAARYNEERKKALSATDHMSEASGGVDDKDNEDGLSMQGRGNTRNVAVREGKSLDLRKERLREGWLG
jgi:hypothetical protein